MTTTNKLLLNGTYLTTSIAVVATIDTNTSFRITQATITNITASAVTFSLYLCLNSTPVTNPTATTIMINKTLDAYETYQLYQLTNHLLLSGYTIQGIAGTATAITLRVSGIQFV